MPDIDVAKRYGRTLKVNCSGGGLAFRIEYDSGATYPRNWLSVNWAQWERLVAWVELQRKEQVLGTGK